MKKDNKEQQISNEEKENGKFNMVEVNCPFNVAQSSKFYLQFLKIWINNQITKQIIDFIILWVEKFKDNKTKPFCETLLFRLK